MTERWAPIPGFEGYYESSSLGLVRSVDRIVSAMRNDQMVRWNYKSRIIKSRPHNGYRVVTISREANHRHAFVHVLILEAFLGLCPPGLECLHANGNRADNRLENLRWGTRSENRHDAVRHGTHPQAKKTHCPAGHPYDEANTIWRRRGGRFCRECQRARGREYMRRKTGYYERRLAEISLEGAR